jgi:hypothetical protein
MDSLHEIISTAMNAADKVNADEVLDLLIAAATVSAAELNLMHLTSQHEKPDNPICNAIFPGWLDSYMEPCKYGASYGDFMSVHATGENGFQISPQDWQTWHETSPGYDLNDLHDIVFSDPVSQFEHNLNPQRWDDWVESVSR